MIDLEIEKAYAKLIVITGPVDHYQENIQILKDLCQKVREDALEEAASVVSDFIYLLDSYRDIENGVTGIIRSLKQAGKGK